MQTVMVRTLPANQWSADAFHKHLDDMVETESDNLKGSIPMTADEIRKSCLLVWLGCAHPAGNA